MEPHLRSARLTPTRRALLVVLTIVVVLGLLPVTSATALTPCEVRCSCARLTPQEQVDRADVVALGRVTEATRPDDPAETAVYGVTVETPVKGTVPREIAVRSHAGTA